MGRTPGSIQRYVSALKDLREMTIGTGWTPLGAHKFSTDRGINHAFITIATKLGYVESREGFGRKLCEYRWKLLTEIGERHAARMLDEVKRTNNHYKQRKITYDEEAARQLESQHRIITLDIRSFDGETLINELRRRGFTGTLIPPSEKIIL